MFLTDEQGRYGGSFLYMMFNWQRTTAALCVIVSTGVATAHHLGLLGEGIDFPTFPLAVVGGALGIFVSFRTNSAYQRWWEGRKLWGRLINTSRHICTQAIAYLPEDQARQTVLRQITYVHALRCGLRKEDAFVDAHITRSMDADDHRELQGSTNLNHALLNRHMAQFIRLNEGGGPQRLPPQRSRRERPSPPRHPGGSGAHQQDPLPAGLRVPGHPPDADLRLRAAVLSGRRGRLLGDPHHPPHLHGVPADQRGGARPREPVHEPLAGPSALRDVVDDRAEPPAGPR